MRLEIANITATSASSS